MNAERWNWELGRYEPHELPEGATCLTWPGKSLVACAGCGENLPYECTYESMEIKSVVRKYAVCGECYDEEQLRTWQRLSSLVYTYDELYKLADELDTENMELRIQVSGLKDANEYLKQENELLKAENEEAKHALWIMEVMEGKK